MRKSGLLLVCSTLISHISAWPSFLRDFPSDIETRALLAKHPFQPVPPGGVRSPCPGTNTLANHGFINRDGKNITRHAYQKGFLDAFNMDFTMTKAGAHGAVGLCGKILGLGRPCTSELTLDMLGTPHHIEHDASLTRNDKEMKDNPDADNIAFNQTVFDRTLEVFGDSTHIGVQHANTARLRRIEQAKEDDAPGWFEELDSGSLKEAAFYLSVMNDPALGQDVLTNPQARVDWIKYWFGKLFYLAPVTHPIRALEYENEQLPTSLGWRKPKDRIVNLPELIERIEAQPTIPAVTSDPTSTTTTDPTQIPTSAPLPSPTRFAGL